MVPVIASDDVVVMIVVLVLIVPVNSADGAVFFRKISVNLFEDPAFAYELGSRDKILQTI